MKPVVLLLSTYPFVEPRHGGQVRLSNILIAYESAGWTVATIAICEAESYRDQPLGKNDLSFPQDSPYRLFNGRSVPFVNDLTSGEYAIAEDAGFSLIQKRLPARIDAIHVEQPWMWPLARKIKRMHVYEHAVLIYGSQNIEAPLKREIFSSYDVSDADDAIKAVDVLERQATHEADLTLAVTQADLDVLAGYDPKQLLLAPNGIAPWAASETALKRWRARLPSAPWILYVASAHPPNFTGFTKCVGNSLGCIPPDSRLVVAGSVGEHIARVVSETSMHSLNLSRLQLLFLLSDEDLAAVKTLAHAFLLPISHGGGSNIKTAEALYSGAYVLGTEAAFRGFEVFLDLPEVTVAHSPHEFQVAMRNILERPAPDRSFDHTRGARDALQWDRCLALVPETVRAILKRVT